MIKSVYLDCKLKALIDYNDKLIYTIYKQVILNVKFCGETKKSHYSMYAILCQI